MSAGFSAKGNPAPRVKSIIAHYHGQSDDQAIAEADAAMINSSVTMLRVPNDLVGEVRALIASRQGRKPKAAPKAASKATKAKSPVRKSA
jgi:hypothetical protein